MSAAAGTVVAMIAMSSAFGVGAAVADEAPATSTTSPSVTPTPRSGPGPVDATEAAADPTPTPTVEPSAEPSADPSDAPPTTAAPTPSADPAVPADSVPTPAAASTPPTVPTADATPAAAPAATAAGTVAVSGTATTWHTLRAVTDGWPTGTTFTYQWTLGTQVVDGATGDSYVLGASEAGNDLTVAVTGTAPDEDPTTVTSASVRVETNDGSTFTTGVRELDAAAGDTISIPIQALTGDQGGLQYGVSRTAEGPVDVGALPVGLTLSSTGVLSGSSTTARVVDFWVLARTTQQPDGAAGQHVQLRIGLAADAQMSAGVSSNDLDDTSAWTVFADGTILFNRRTDPTRPITSMVGAGITVNAGLSDRYGNTEPYAVVDNDWTSSVASDVLGKYDPGTGVGFFEPGDRVLTGRAVDGRTISFTVHVAPAEAAVAPTTPAEVPVAAGSDGPGAGASGPTQLAFTGADETGPIAWALGLLAAGAALLTARLGRRRA
ncbi:hypothetical protein BIU98_04450 [Curtobacterium sp. MMLR14_010]|uniref:hypothetical protein n=1 Tax=Curtobacterium sp. MMLR14_010 TaxID=1898743 RepID=UPI0008DE054B|nr:hypothetical protein [Curtobacterium sp. MMLR14_010]OII35178.1 hypothetical protein BIU98_04450 [Curtobacterium sp. MMLR14_010]